MKILLLLATVVVAIHSQGSFFSYLSLEWITFKQTYKKIYTSMKEDAYRFQIYKKNVETVRAHNTEYVKGTVPYTLRINKYSDMTRDEIVKVMNGFKIIARQTLANVRNLPGGTRMLTGSPPESVDWRTLHVVSEVHDQGLCASDWAFAAAGSIETRYAIRSGTLVPLSAQNLLDCSRRPPNAGCNGGNMVRAYQYLKANDGIDTEASYPYTGIPTYCNYDPINRRAIRYDFGEVAPGDEDDMLTFVGFVSAVSAGIDASHTTFHLYGRGIYVEPACNPNEVDHAVLIVGYGTEKDQRGRDWQYWLAKNSWGTTWGEDGYIKMPRNYSNHCGIVTSASLALIL